MTNPGDILTDDFIRRVAERAGAYFDLASGIRAPRANMRSIRAGIVYTVGYVLNEERGTAESVPPFETGEQQ